MDQGFRLLPEAGSEGAAAVDVLYFAVMGVSAFFTLLICALIVTFMVRYHHTKHVDRTLHTHGAGVMALEITWTVIPLAIVMVFFTWGAVQCYWYYRPPTNVLDVYVVGKQWMWKLQHEGGRREIDTLHVPAGQPVRLNMISEDVIHSFYLPAFRVKRDVLPGRYTTLWFDAGEPSESHLFCAEYCGTSHSDMIGKIVVMPPSEYAEWAGEQQDRTLAELGHALFDAYKCSGCHENSEVAQAPPLTGVYGSNVPLQGGKSIVADDAYVRESILDPNAKVVAGFATSDGRSIMPSFEGQISEADLFQLIAYIRTLGKTPAAEKAQ